MPALALLGLLSGCGMVLLDPAGDIARQQSDLMIRSTILMLLIVVPVIVLTLVFAWRYRESNSSAEYDPDWDHSTHVELYVWAAPLLIIIAIGAMTWVTTHLLDPYRPLTQLDGDRVATDDVLHIQAVALEWKWLFIYPEQNIAVVNELAAPVDRPIRFSITSPRIMNSLFIPTLAGMIYGMPGMKTTLHAVINEPGDYPGVSGNYSGEGYSQMRFRFKGLSNEAFDAWIADAKASGQRLDTARQRVLAENSVDHPVVRFASVEAGLFEKILNLCVQPGQMCINEMMRRDARAHRGEHAPESGHGPAPY